ncbi:carbohydrate-binding protein [Sphaerisporangium album]|uniref:Carbohydrate-binding protein n=1 Tax=Sphaerisporangium album TaxID=509200 RepID=A0A367F8P8_9ACTN|nr:glycosyl hydrolase family 28 protein [Sphaerisporangium album]RCG25940.1 carbohydrate-binding protein [Sphaerisporangium album]
MRRTAILLVLLLTALGLQSPASALAEFNVRDYGATGNGSTNDDDAIDRAINAANAAGGGIVVFPSGRYRSRTIHLKSDVTLRLDSGSVILAASSGMDAAESNGNDDYQDYGHSHFHNALMWGNGITNFHITGTGTIDGDGKLITGNPSSGQADKAIVLTECSNVSLTGVTIRRGGHFGALINGCHDLTIDDLKTVYADSGVRDGINLINSWNVTVTNSRIEASDDALVFKSDYALGHTYTSRNVRVRDTTVYSHENNALQFGSETCGDFRDFRFDNITVLGAGKAGIGIVTMDGAVIEDVHYDHVTLTKTTSPIFMKIGERRRCPGSPPAGRIRNITISNVTGTNLTAPVVTGTVGASDYSSTLTGTPAVDIGPGITLDNVDLTVPGGHPASEATRVPGEFLSTYPPRDYGPRPSYGYWIRHATGITLGGDLRFTSNDGRPAVIADDGSNIVLDGVVAQRGSSSAYDAGFSGIAGYAVRGSTNTTGGALRVRATNSTPLPSGPAVTVATEAEGGTVTAPMQRASDGAASGGSYVTVAPGNNSQASAPSSGYATVTVNVPSAGTYKIMGRVVAPADTDDSFWVRVDGGAWVNWNDIAPGASWHWADITNDAASDTLVTYDLAAGDHTLTFAYREDGARLDRVLVTTDLSLAPTGTGP